MMRLDVNPANFLVVPSDVPPELTMRVEPVLGGVRIELVSAEMLQAQQSMKAQRDMDREEQLGDLVKMAGPLAQQIVEGMARRGQPAVSPCADCKGKVSFMVAVHPFEVQIDGVLRTFIPGVYRWEKGEPAYVGTIESTRPVPEESEPDGTH